MNISALSVTSIFALLAFSQMVAAASDAASEPLLSLRSTHTSGNRDVISMTNLHSQLGYQARDGPSSVKWSEGRLENMAMRQRRIRQRLLTFDAPRAGEPTTFSSQIIREAPAPGATGTLSSIGTENNTFRRRCTSCCRASSGGRCSNCFVRGVPTTSGGPMRCRTGSRLGTATAPSSCFFTHCSNALRNRRGCACRR